MWAATEREFIPGIELRTSSIKPSQAYYIPLNIWLTLAADFQNCRFAFPFLVLLPPAITTVTWFSKYNQQILALQQHSVCCQDWEPIYLSTVWRFISSLTIPTSRQREFNNRSEVNHHDTQEELIPLSV